MWLHIGHIPVPQYDTWYQHSSQQCNIAIARSNLFIQFTNQLFFSKNMYKSRLTFRFLQSSRFLLLQFLPPFYLAPHETKNWLRLARCIIAQRAGVEYSRLGCSLYMYDIYYNACRVKGSQRHTRHTRYHGTWFLVLIAVASFGIIIYISVGDYCY